MAKTWQQKFEGAPSPEVQVLEKPYAGAPAGARMLISSPAEIEQWISNTKPGAIKSPHELRNSLAATHHADMTCPLTTGIFLRIVAERSLEQSLQIPFWRVIDPKSPLAKKLSCGPNYIERMRLQEQV